MKARLIIDSTRRSPDLLYLTGFRAPDPVIWLQVGRESFLVLSDLELDRGRSTARVTRCLALTQLARRARARLTCPPSPAHVAALALEDRGARRVEIPATFPALYVPHLEQMGLVPVIVPGPFVPRRRRKTRREVEAMRRCQRAGEQGMVIAAGMIARARRRGRRLVLDGQPLTSERLKSEVSVALLSRGYQAAGLIIAGRPEQSCLPHHSGSGALLADHAIIMDFFPRSLETGYHGDETRTVVRGRPSPRLSAMARAVREAERRAARMLRPGVRGAEIHARTVEFLAAEGFRTERRGSRPRGFFHGLGHGLGLEIHEAPSLSGPDTVLAVGDVVTVEPGLYYPRTGGVRHENLYHIGRKGTEPLSSLDLDLIIP
jgi:Xaa-Pro aminopeptidase